MMKYTSPHRVHISFSARDLNTIMQSVTRVQVTKLSDATLLIFVTCLVVIACRGTQSSIPETSEGIAWTGIRKRVYNLSTYACTALQRAVFRTAPYMDHQGTLWYQNRLHTHFQSAPEQQLGTACCSSLSMALRSSNGLVFPQSPLSVVMAFKGGGCKPVGRTSGVCSSQ